MRSIAVIGVILVLFWIAMHARQVDQPQTPTSKGATAATTDQKAGPKEAPSAEKATSQGGVVVFVDPQTGQIREPTPEEIGTLAAPTTQRLQSQPQVVVQAPDGRGGVGIVLGTEFQTYTVATKTPDGNLHMEEVTGEKAARGRVNPGQTPKAGDGK